MEMDKTPSDTDWMVVIAQIDEPPYFVKCRNCAWLACHILKSSPLRVLFSEGSMTVTGQSKRMEKINEMFHDDENLAQLLDDDIECDTLWYSNGKLKADLPWAQLRSFTQKQQLKDAYEKRVSAYKARRYSYRGDPHPTLTFKRFYECVNDFFRVLAFTCLAWGGREQEVMDNLDAHILPLKIDTHEDVVGGLEALTCPKNAPKPYRRSFVLLCDRIKANKRSNTDSKKDDDDLLANEEDNADVDESEKDHEEDNTDDDESKRDHDGKEDDDKKSKKDDDVLPAEEEDGDDGNDGNDGDDDVKGSAPKGADDDDDNDVKADDDDEDDSSKDESSIDASIDDNIDRDEGKGKDPPASAKNAEAADNIMAEIFAKGDKQFTEFVVRALDGKRLDEYMSSSTGGTCGKRGC